MTAGLLLDTCAVIWVANGDDISDDARQTIEEAAAESKVFVSPITAWEIATLVRKGRIALTMPHEDWFETFLKRAGVDLAPMPPRTLMASAFLPGAPPNDPADRIIAATARAENFQLVTRDRRLLSYANAGHLRAMDC